MTIMSRFMCYIPFCKFTTKAGKDINFLNGEHITGNQADIDELNAEIAAGHPHIYVNKDKATVDSSTLDPLEEIKRKAVADYIASQAAAIDPTKDLGTTKSEPLKVTTSADIIKAASGSSAAV